MSRNPQPLIKICSHCQHYSVSDAEITHTNHDTNEKRKFCRTVHSCGLDRHNGFAMKAWWQWRPTYMLIDPSYWGNYRTAYNVKPESPDECPYNLELVLVQGNK